LIRIVLIFIAVAGMAGAATPVARITSPGSFQLSGQRVPKSSVPNWPLVVGDSVTLGKKPARITFRDGSVVFLTPESKVEITSVNGVTVVRLRHGGAAYRFTGGSAVSLAGGNLRPVSSSSREGRMLVNGADALWNPVEAEFYLYGAGSQPTGRRAQVADKITMDSDNYNLEQIEGYRDYEADWGTPPGENGTGVVPPPAATAPGQDDPASAYAP
jgi:hypothetical protein